MRSKRMTLMGLAVLVLLGQRLSAIAEERNEKEEEGAEQAKNLPYPDSIAGFSGLVRGVVVEKKPQDIITFKVAKIGKLGEGNKAQDANALVGKTVQVAWGTKEDKLGKLCKAFIQKLKEGDRIGLELKHFDKDTFTILELSEDQRTVALGGEPRWRREEGHRGRRGKHGNREKEERAEAQREGKDRAEGEGKRKDGDGEKEGQVDMSDVDNDYDD